MRFGFICMLLILPAVLLANQENGDDYQKGHQRRSVSTSKQRRKRLPRRKENDDYETNSIEDVKEFVRMVNEEQLEIKNKVMLADFKYHTNLTEHNKRIYDKIVSEEEKLNKKYRNEAQKFKWKNFKTNHPTLYRWFKLFLKAPIFKSDIENSVYSQTEKSMQKIFNEARVCQFNTRPKNCSLQLEPTLLTIMAKSRNPDELKFYWKKFRDASGREMRSIFMKIVESYNKHAEESGFQDYSELLVNEYECKNFLDNMAKVMKEIMPLYRQYHAYVRRKLARYYKNVEIKEDGPIPAHLLGNMYAQNWADVFDIIRPFRNKNAPNVTESMLKKKMEPIDMFILAEKFFVSIGLEKMTPHFWARSVIKKPTDREMVCHAGAYDFYNGKDFRIKQCTKITESDLKTVHHEMGHIEYDMLYKDQLAVFREGANYGFHEAVGDVMSLSVLTTDYYKKIHLLEKDFHESEEMDIINLFKVASFFLPTVPYSYIVDHYRHHIYNGSIPENKLNEFWWKYRLDYQGVCPPVRRTEKDFDAGAKYHVAYSIEYMRYFFANVFTFQIHKALCKRANHQGPLHKCSIYESKAAGALLREVLSLGKSKPWPEVMLKLTGETSELSAEPLLEYFRPLERWLKKRNRGKFVGWKSDDPMQCP